MLVVRDTSCTDRCRSARRGDVEPVVRRDLRQDLRADAESCGTPPSAEAPADLDTWSCSCPLGPGVPRRVQSFAGVRLEPLPTPTPIALCSPGRPAEGRAAAVAARPAAQTTGLRITGMPSSWSWLRPYARASGVRFRYPSLTLEAVDVKWSRFPCPSSGSSTTDGPRRDSR